MKRYDLQLYEIGTGRSIRDSGGFIIVCKAGLPQKESLLTDAGAAKTNGFALTNGRAEFNVADAVASVDLYIMCPGNQFTVLKSVVPGYESQVFVDVHQPTQVMVIPWSAYDQSADATETDSGFDEPASNKAVFTSFGAGVLIGVVDAGKTVSTGTGEVHPADGGDADGFALNQSCTTAAMALSANDNYSSSVHQSGGKSITSTISTGATTAGGFSILPYTLTN